MVTRTEEVRLVRLDVDAKDLERAARALNRNFGELNKQAKAARLQLRGLNRQAETLRNVFAGFAALRFGDAIVGQLADFSQSMAEVKAISGATGDTFDQLRSQARALGADTIFTATQAAQGQKFLAQAGFEVNEILAATPATLSLAQAGVLDLGRAADIASNVLTGFNKEAAETGRVADILAKTAASANTNIELLGSGLSYVAPLAAGFNVSLEETSAAIGVLSNAGIQGERAGTSLRRVLAELESPGSTARRVFNNLGIELDKIRPSVVGLEGALPELADNGFTVTDAMQAFQQRGGPAVGVLLSALRNLGEDGSNELNRLTRTLENSEGAATAMAATMDDNLKGSLRRLSSAAQELNLALGDQGVESTLRPLADGGASALRTIARNLETIVPLASGAAAGLLTLGGSALIAKLGGVTAALKGITATLGLLGKASLANPLTAVTAVAVTAGVALSGLRRSAADVEAEMNDVSRAVERYTSTSNILRDDTTKLASLNRQLETAIRDQKPAIEATLRADIGALDRRIAKTKELQAVYAAQARAELPEVERALKSLRREALKDFRPRGTSNDIGRLGRAERRQELPDFSVFEREIELITARQDAGEKLNRTDEKRLRQFAEIAEAQQRFESLQKTINATLDETKTPDLEPAKLAVEVEPIPEIRPVIDTSDATALADALREAKNQLDALKNQVVNIDLRIAGENGTDAGAILATFDERLKVADEYYTAASRAANDNAASREALERENATRLANIAQSRNAALIQLERDLNRDLEQIRATIQDDGIGGELSRASFEFGDRTAALKELQRQEIALARATGQDVLAVNAEFKRLELASLARFEQDKQNIIDTANAATRQLDISLERDPFERDRLIAQDQFETQRLALERWREDQIAIANATNGDLEIIERQHAARMSQIQADEANELRQITLAEASFRVSTAQNVTSDLVTISKTLLGENSKAYKTLFRINQAFAIADATIKGAQAVQTALASAPPPVNFALATAAGVAAVAQITTISAQKFATGGKVPSLVSNGELYIGPKAVARIGERNLEQLNDGIGILRGPGTGTSDQIAANLPSGSFIVREAVASKIQNKFATGGLVGKPSNSKSKGVTTSNKATGGVSINLNNTFNIGENVSPENAQRQAKEIAKAQESLVRSVIAKELRAGGMLRGAA